MRWFFDNRIRELFISALKGMEFDLKIPKN
jgi:hypothetical protein